MNEIEFVKSLGGVIDAEYDDNELVVIVDPTHASVTDGIFTRGQWERTCHEHRHSEEHGEVVRIVYTRHKVDSLCFAAPFVISDFDAFDVEKPTDVLDARKLDLDNFKEATSQGYFRRQEWIQCTCGEVFDGNQAFTDFEEHCHLK